ncbi:MAG: hypothetical protein ABIH26_10955 [Candidatus Eisenbacteria bacterium]
MASRAPDPGWGFWGRWLAATTIGWVVGAVSAIVLSYLVVNLVYPKTTNLIVGVCMGAAVGLSQKIAARRWLSLSHAWTRGAAIGLGIPFVLGVLADELRPFGVRLPEDGPFGVLLVGVGGGLIAGLLQVRVLRPHTSRAGAWAWASVLSWGLAWLSTTLGGPVGLLGGVVLGAASGGLLVWLLKSPAAEAA